MLLLAFQVALHKQVGMPSTASSSSSQLQYQLWTQEEQTQAPSVAEQFPAVQVQQGSSKTLVGSNGASDSIQGKQNHFVPGSLMLLDSTLMFDGIAGLRAHLHSQRGGEETNKKLQEMKC